MAHCILLNDLKICFLDWSKPYISLFGQTSWSPHKR